MTNDEKVRIDATIGEFTNAVLRNLHRSVDLAAELASVSAQLKAAREELAALKEPTGNVVPIDKAPA